jgi:hydrogenase nickel incorporation protein HypA/HybF
MHEMSLLADLMQKLHALARENEGGRIVGVRVRLGALAHLSAGHLRAHFEQAVRGTSFEGARLEVIEDADLRDPHAQDLLLDSVDLQT